MLNGLDTVHSTTCNALMTYGGLGIVSIFLFMLAETILTSKDWEGNKTGILLLRFKGREVW